MQRRSLFLALFAAAALALPQDAEAQQAARPHRQRQAARSGETPEQRRRRLAEARRRRQAEARRNAAERQRRRHQG